MGLQILDPETGQILNPEAGEHVIIPDALAAR
jgi:hypothetical protein